MAAGNRNHTIIGYNVEKQNLLRQIMKKIWKAFRNYFKKDCCKV